MTHLSTISRQKVALPAKIVWSTLLRKENASQLAAVMAITITLIGNSACAQQLNPMKIQMEGVSPVFCLGIGMKQLEIVSRALNLLSSILQQENVCLAQLKSPTQSEFSVLAVQMD